MPPTAPIRVHTPPIAIVDALPPPTDGTPVQTLLPYGVGIDTHRDFLQVCVLVQGRGEVVRFEREFQTTWGDMKAGRAWAEACIRGVQTTTRRAVKVGLFDDTSLDPASFRYTIESTGTYHMPVLRAWGGQPSVINPQHAGQTKRKTDVLDARMLAHHSMCGLWPISHVMTVDVEVLRVLLGMRAEAGRQATRATNRINNHVLRFGHTIGRDQKMADMTARAAIEDMCRGVVPMIDTVCPDGIPVDARLFFVDAYAMYDRACDLRLKYHARALAFVRGRTWPCRDGPVKGGELLKHLMTVPGVGEVGALTWLSTIGDPRRFVGQKQVAAFCGCDPSLKVSAGKVTAHVKRKGNAKLHQVLKNVAAQLVRKHNEPIGQWGFALQRRNAKGGWARAINAVSRRVAIFLWQVHLRADDFSYEQYRFYLVEPVKDVPLLEMGLGPRYTQMLIEAGFTRSTDIAAGFLSTLPQTKGIGVGCLNHVKEWLSQNRLTDSSSSGGLPDVGASTSPTKGAGKSGTRSTTTSRPPPAPSVTRSGRPRRSTPSDKS